MNLNIYTIFDSAANAYMQPFFLHNDGLAIRSFSDTINAKEPNNISEHPDQFTLFKIGTYDDTNGHLANDEPVSLGNAITFKTEQNQTFTIEDLKKLLLDDPKPHLKSVGEK